MKKIVNNEYNLKEEDITEVVKRVKAIIINSKNEVLMGYSHHNYQFIGGHVDDNESLNDALVREIKEETGVNITNIKEPFICSYGYWKNHPSPGKNRKTEVYCYEVLCNQKPNYDLINYTSHEKEGNFELRYIKLDKLEEEIKNNVSKYGDDKGIAKEILSILKEYKGV